MVRARGLGWAENREQSWDGDPAGSRRSDGLSRDPWPGKGDVSGCSLKDSMVDLWVREKSQC